MHETRKVAVYKIDMNNYNRLESVIRNELLQFGQMVLRGN